MPPKKNGPRITLSTLKALAIFLEQHPEPLAGADIFNRTKMFSGTLYPVLARLEEAGWLSSVWEDIDPTEVGRPRKRLYKLTAFGLVRARAEFERLGRETGVFGLPDFAKSGVKPA
ncbi:MAG: PadR family transcriptional regulator [Alphaproteobacteria bacterium]|jgi:PadR family transcriptional regulator, regulatory protein PadR|nr:MAG: PadR family transcriptional regulator [Alphaproteobacteria bacterium]